MTAALIARLVLILTPRRSVQDPNAAFPSGDVGGAVSVAYALIRCGGDCRLALACVVLSAFGRLYWQAHHLLDVLAGALISLVTCMALELLLQHRGDQGSAISVAWWHPAIALIVLFVQQRVQKMILRRRAAAKHE